MAGASGPSIEDVGGPIARLFGEGTASGLDEGELLRRFANARDPVALEVLVARHGPMVLGVCRRVLGDRHSSEDAFQATFLVLVRKAGSIRDPDRLGPWLHGVAHRVAVRSRADRARRDARERPGAEDLAMEMSSADESGLNRLELRAALDEEVRRLPEKFRDPIVLCYLDGLTHDEAATRLRCPVGTVRSRLSTGRARLRDRLNRRGVAVPSGVFAAVLSAEAAGAAVSPALMVSTVKAATAFAGGLAGATAAGMVSAGVASLAEGAVKSMIVSKLKMVGAAALAGMLTVGVGGVAAYQVGGTTKAEDPKAETTANVLKKALNEIRLAEAEVSRWMAEYRKAGTELEAAQARLVALMGVPPQDPKKQPDELPAPLSSREQESEAQTRKLKAELESARAELEAVKSRLQALTPKGASATPPGGMGMGMGFGMGAGGGGGGMGMGSGGGGGGGGGGMAMMGGDRMMGGMMGGGGMGGMMGGDRMMGRMMGGGGTGGVMGNGERPLAALQSDDFVIVHRPKSTRVAGYSTAAGSWASYEVPKGMDVVPISAPGIVALMGVGEEIGQIAAFVPASGRWYPIDLKEPAKGRAVPIVGQGQAAYTIGRRVYAFSALAETWDVLELPEGAKPVAVVYPSRANVEHDDHIYIFSVKTGKWTDFDAKAGRVASPGAK